MGEAMQNAMLTRPTKTLGKGIKRINRGYAGEKQEQEKSRTKSGR